MTTKPQTRHRHAELPGSLPSGTLFCSLFLFPPPPRFASDDFVRRPKKLSEEESRWGAMPRCVCVCICLIDTHTQAVMSQAPYCGCRPDSLIREECCPWHPEFSTEITHSSRLFPAPGSSSQPEQTRRGNPLSPSSHCVRPLPHCMHSHKTNPPVRPPHTRHTHTHTHPFFFLQHHLGSVNAGSLFSASLLDLAILAVE